MLNCRVPCKWDTLIKVGELVKENPEEAAKIVRLWLQDAA